MNSLFAAYVLAAFATAIPGQVVALDPAPPPATAYIHPQTWTRLPDGRRFNMVCSGTGSPTAILDASLSQWSLAWFGIQPRFAAVTRTCAIDRPGFGFSDAGPEPRDARSKVADLRNALRSLQMSGPFILVGHSLGGQEMRLFAYEEPQSVAAMLLIDPGIENVDEQLGYPKGTFEQDLPYYNYCLSQARAGTLVPGQIRKGDEEACLGSPSAARPQSERDGIIRVLSRPSRFATTISEINNYNTRTSEELIAERHSLGRVPLVVLSSDKSNFTSDRPPGTDPDRIYARWREAHDKQAADSLQGESRIVPGAGHWIFRDKPDVVVAAFSQIVEQVRSSMSAAPAM